MKNVGVIPWLFFMLTGLYALTACTANSAMTSHSGHEVEKSIEGTYAVYFGQNLALIGKLNLSNGQYSFLSQPNSDQDETVADSRFFFIRYPQGVYRTDYPDSVTAQSLLEDLDDNKIVATVFFEEVGVKAPRHNLPDSDQAFLIRNNPVEAKLYFHSTVSEFELWRIEKSWEPKLSGLLEASNVP